jgi:iron complex outermembrane receptor protein
MAFAASTIAVAVAAIATPVFAQSTGSVEFEKDIVVTGAKVKAVNGINLPDTPKAKQVLDQSYISMATPGQSINDTINMIPGVASFNADPFGSSGGKLYIRGFDNSRISKPSTACRRMTPATTRSIRTRSSTPSCSTT